MKLFKKKDSDKFKEFVVKCNGKNGTVIGITKGNYKKCQEKRKMRQIQ